MVSRGAVDIVRNHETDERHENGIDYNVSDTLKVSDTFDFFVCFVCFVVIVNSIGKDDFVFGHTLNRD